MKGLLVKDMLIMSCQKKTLIMIVVIGTVMSLSFEPVTVIAYLTVFASIMALGTLSYDEVDNGYTFLFTLPMSRKTYVLEKYVFVTLWSLVFMIIGSVISIVIYIASEHHIEFMAMLTMAGAMLIPVFFVSAVMIPLKLKYGSEKSRTVLFIIYGLIAVTVIGLEKIPALAPAAAKVESILTSLNGAVIALIILLVSFALFALSFAISVKIVEKKEF